MKNLQKILLSVVLLAGGLVVSADSEVSPEVVVSEAVCAECPASAPQEPACVVEECIVEVAAPQPSLTVVLPGNRVVVFNPLLCDVPVEVASAVADILVNACPDFAAALSLSRADLTIFVSNLAVLVKHRYLQMSGLLSVDTAGVQKDFFPVVISGEAAASIECARLGVRDFASRLVVADEVFEPLAPCNGMFKSLTRDLAKFLLDFSGDNDEQVFAAVKEAMSKRDEFVKQYSDNERMLLMMLIQGIFQACEKVQAIGECFKTQTTSLDVYNLYSKIVVFVDRPALSGVCEAICVPDKKEIYTDLTVVGDDSLSCDHGIKMSFERDAEGKMIRLIVGSDITAKPVIEFAPVEEDVVVSEPGSWRYEMAITGAGNVIVFNNGNAN